MPAHNFTLADLGACAEAFALFPLYVVLPGYVAAWLLDLFAFRRRTVPFRLALSIPLSISLGPIAVYLLGAWLFWPIWLSFAGLVCWEWWGRRFRLPETQKLRLTPFFVWIVLALLSLVDLQLGDRLYYSIIGYDYSIRTEMIHSLATAGIPPRTPFFFPGHDVPLRYHYFWLMLCSQVARLGFGARAALIAGTPWCGFGLMGLVALYLRLFSPLGASRLSRRTAIAMALLGVTGLDILPTLLLIGLKVAGLSGMIFPSMEWWNEQVDGWVYTMLWEPHHLSGLIACFTGFLCLWRAPEEPGRGGLWKNSIVAGAAFATAVGSSIHIVFVFAIFLAVWTIITMLRRWPADLKAAIVAGITCVALALPYLRSMTGAGSGGPPLTWTVRTFMLPEFVLRAFGMHGWQIPVADLVLLPVNYVMELGLFFAVGWWRWKIWRAKGYALERQDVAAAAMIAVSVVICTFLRSSLISNNDLGWRGFLIAQFALLLWAADLLADWPQVPHRALLALLIGLGAAGTVYDLAILRVYPMLADRGAAPTLPWMSPDRQLGRRNFAAREAYEWARAATGPNAIVQYNPDVPVQETAGLLYAERQAVAADPRCLTTFGGDAHECAPIEQSLQQLFSAGGDPAAFARVCSTLPIDILVAKDIDPAWSNHESWVWREQPVFANDYVRLFRCMGRQ
jgi:hypothetical protein